MYKKDGYLPVTVCEAIAKAGRKAIGESTKDQKYAYPNKDAFWGAMRKHVQNAPTRNRKKKSREVTRNIKHPSELTQDMEKHRDVVQERQEARRKRRAERKSEAESQVCSKKMKCSK